MTRTHDYAGFWIRLGATLVDGLILLLITAPLMTLIYGSQYWVSSQTYYGVWDVLINFVLPTVGTILLWQRFSATPGKLATRLAIVDARTGRPMTTRQAIIRYLAYLVSVVPLCLGFVWVAFDRRKQGWHDKIAKTVVIRRHGREQVIIQDNPVIKQAP